MLPLADRQNHVTLQGVGPCADGPRHAGSVASEWIFTLFYFQFSHSVVHYVLLWDNALIHIEVEF